MDKNVKNNVFDSYDVNWDHGALEETELVHSLITNFDFIDANTSTQIGIQKLKDAEKNKGGAEDEFDDEFGDYQKDLKPSGVQEEVKSGAKIDDNF